MAGVVPCSSSTLSLLTSLNFHYQEQCRALHAHSFILSTQRRGLYVCAAKKKVSFTDQILDYIEGNLCFHLSVVLIICKVFSGPNWVWLLSVHSCYLLSKSLCLIV